MKKTHELRVHDATEGDLVVDGGWTPPDERTSEQKAMSDEFDNRVQAFGVVGIALSELPEKALLFELEIKAAGKLLPRPHQVTGSCVGVGGMRAYSQAICGDVVHRGDNEAVKIPFPFATYGVGRQLGGFRRKGEGSFGASQAKAIEQFGMVAWDHPKVPKPTISRGWAKWTQSQEYSWSHPSAWPVPYREMEPDANKHTIESVVRIKGTEDAKQLLAQGYGVTLASMFGTRPRVRGGFLVGEWNASWSHQMSCSGYYTHSDLGVLYLIDNQWGPRGHNANCPWLEKYGVTGSFWVREEVFARIIRNGEVFGHSATNGFPAQEFDWGNPYPQ